LKRSNVKKQQRKLGYFGIPSRRRSTACAWLAILVLSFTMPCSAEPQDIPAETQLPIFFKLLTYDRTLWEVPEPRLRIGLLHRLGDDMSRRNLVVMLEALDASSDKTINGVAFEFVTLSWKDADDLARQLAHTDIDVLYVTRGHHAHLNSVAGITRSNGILTLAGDAGDVGRGLSVGIGLDGERLRIEVDLEALAAEGHQLDARVLRLCRVVNR
jgi:hypothetical protein